MHVQSPIQPKLWPPAKLFVEFVGDGGPHSNSIQIHDKSSDCNDVFYAARGAGGIWCVTRKVITS